MIFFYLSLNVNVILIYIFIILISIIIYTIKQMEGIKYLFNISDMINGKHNILISIICYFETTIYDISKIIAKKLKLN